MKPSPRPWIPLVALAALVGCEPDATQPDAGSQPDAAIAGSELGGTIHFERGRPSRSLAAVAVEEAPPSELRYSETVFNTDLATAGVGGLRNTIGGLINLSGVTGSVNRALLYWHGPTNSTDLGINAGITLNETPVQATVLGLASDNCWGYENSIAYFADVTDIVLAAPEVNSAYRLANYGNSNDIPGEANTNGASLIVFYQDGFQGNNRDIAVFHGNDSNVESIYDPFGWDVTLSGIDYSSGTANLELHVADGQSIGEDDALILNGSVLEARGHIFSGNTVGGLKPDGLWDIRSWNVTDYLNPGQNALNLTTGLWGDCLGLIVALVDLPAGAAPTPDFAFLPTTWSMSRTSTLTVYLLSSADFDATQADPAEARMIMDNSGSGAPVARRGSTYLSSVRDFNGDGLQDRLMVFNVSDLRAAGLTTGTSSLTLADRTGAFQYNGRPNQFPTLVP